MNAALLSLPEKVHLKILGFCKIQEITTLRQVKKYFRDLVDNKAHSLYNSLEFDIKIVYPAFRFAQLQYASHNKALEKTRKEIEECRRQLTDSQEKTNLLNQIFNPFSYANEKSFQNETLLKIKQLRWKKNELKQLILILKENYQITRNECAQLIAERDVSSLSKKFLNHFVTSTPKEPSLKIQASFFKKHSMLRDLPRDLHLYILYFCNPRKITACRQLNSYFQEIIDQNEREFYSPIELYIKIAYPAVAVAERHHHIHCKMLNYIEKIMDEYSMEYSKVDDNSTIETRIECRYEKLQMQKTELLKIIDLLKENYLVHMRACYQFLKKDYFLTELITLQEYSINNDKVKNISESFLDKLDYYFEPIPQWQ